MKKEQVRADVFWLIEFQSQEDSLTFTDDMYLGRKAVDDKGETHKGVGMDDILIEGFRSLINGYIQSKGGTKRLTRGQLKKKTLLFELVDAVSKLLP